MSVITPPDDAAVDVADEPQQSLIKRITACNRYGSSASLW